MRYEFCVEFEIEVQNEDDLNWAAQAALGAIQAEVDPYARKIGYGASLKGGSEQKC